ncbi:unnamed protein product [Linum trigynum]|uniref:F-box/LRR-repeat protein 15/At3g58940/PEG3-like LRR domain-containing protein n=1 Tax=Linum trigynum TaxID=586398 RepID=A0AAV2FC05_9ROSI
MELACDLEEIDIHVELPSPMREVPKSFYTLNNLKVLKLASVMIMDAQGSVFLPRMKTLKLSGVKTMEGESFSRLIDGCPAHLEECCCFSRPKITTSSQFLKSMTIVGNHDLQNTVHPIVIQAPNLEHLQLWNFEELEIVGNSPWSGLESARLDVSYQNHASLIALLARISNAKQMWLSSQTLVIIQNYSFFSCSP